MPSDETARNSVIGTESAEGCTELESFKAVSGADGYAFILYVRIFEIAVWRLHVAHVTCGKFSLER